MKGRERESNKQERVVESQSRNHPFDANNVRVAETLAKSLSPNADRTVERPLLIRPQKKYRRFF